MAIKRIKISNFKSFREAEIELGNFSVLIGANASGKSNFIQIFRFLRDAIEFGLDNAISMQAGVEYFRNMNVGSSKEFSIQITSDRSQSYFSMENEPEVEGYETTYRFALKFRGLRSFEISEDELIQKCRFYKNIKTKGKKVKELIGEGEIVLSRKDNKGQISLNVPNGLKMDAEAVFEIAMTNRFLCSPKIIRPRNLFIESQYFLVGTSLKNNLNSISLYDFDPKLPKKAQAISGKAEMEEDGSNIAMILRGIMKSGNQRRKFFNIIKDVLPFVDGLFVETFADKSLMFKIRESYSGRRFLPASLLSDGTLNMTALVLSLYFGEKELKIIEEPGRNIHPYLISRVVKMMKEASAKSQIIVTTHNPEIIKHANLEDILLISRDKDGYSNISRAYEKEEIKVFLENEMGMDELFVQNLLEI